jgi:hypothetical protein
LISVFKSPLYYNYAIPFIRNENFRKIRLESVEDVARLRQSIEKEGNAVLNIIEGIK